MQETVAPEATRLLAQPAAVTGIPLATLNQRVTKDHATVLRPTFGSKGRQTLARLKGRATFHETFTFTPTSGKAVKSTATFTLTPAPAGPSVAQPPPPSTTATITSVLFRGGPGNPSVELRGSHLGALPRPDPTGHPSGQGGCPVVSGDTGYDYGTSLYVVLLAKGWSAGRYNPSANETDCVDLVVTKFTSSEVDFHFGPFYATYHSKFSINTGDQVQIGVNGTTKTVHVAYGIAVTS